MRQKTMSSKEPAEKVVRGIRRRLLRRHTAIIERREKIKKLTIKNRA